MGREGARDKGFFVQTISEDSGALNFETYYTNIRKKKKLIEGFQKRIQELGDCDESIYLTQHCETLQKEVDELMDLFRGKITEKRKKIVYIPMDTFHALNYLGYLIEEDIDKNLDDIRNIMNALEYETGATQEDKNQISYYKRLINYFKQRVDNAKES